MELVLWAVPEGSPPLDALKAAAPARGLRGDIEQEPSFVRFATFVALFPQLVAGPIERARNLLPQLAGQP